jgi:16S rRNA (adenine1518-N6/adenine1519-N6)-dimethyltransferase
MRMAERPGSKVYGILSVLLQAFYDIEYLFTVNETVFDPPPKVKSAVVRFKRNTRQELPCDEALFIKVVKTTFNQRRKTIRNSIKPILGDRKLEHPFMDERPEQLSVEQFIELTTLISPVNQ